MQSRLPDVNTAFIKRRNGAEEGLASKNWDKVFGNLYSWNALLPRNKLEDNVTYKYRVRISDIDYEKLTANKSEVTCNHCKKELDYNEITVFDMLLKFEEQILIQDKTTQSWLCPLCNKENWITETIISESVFQEPYFFGVVPKPPHRQDGLNDRGKYERKVTRWAWNFIAELEEKSTQFREDYKENKADFEAWDEIEDGGETVEV